MKNKKIYLLSGLGVDKRVFKNLDLTEFNVVHVKWIPPFENESLENYATRLLSQIPSPNPILVGLSFGGMVAIEFAKQLETEKIILLSSAKTKWEIPFLYRFIGKYRIHKWIPTAFLKKSNWISNWFFGAKSNAEKQLLKQILLDTDPVFLKWALDKVLTWNNTIKIDNAFHLHGTKDHVLPIRKVKWDYEIKNGGHLMTLTNAEEISEILRKII